MLHKAYLRTRCLNTMLIPMNNNYDKCVDTLVSYIFYISL